MTPRPVDLLIQEKRFGAKRILVDVGFHVSPGEIVSIVGRSGCGKSTLLRIICGLDTEYRGQVNVLGHRPRLHSGEVGVIFQEPRLLPWLTVVQNVGFDLGRRGARHPRVRELLLEVGLSEHADAYPKQLSGGMAQRAAIARGLFTQPSLLLLDEPFSAVDALTRIRLQDLLLSIAFAHGTSLLLVTHDIAEATYLSDRVVALSSRPGIRGGELTVGLPRPRDRSDPELTRLQSHVLTLIEPGSSTQGAYPSAAPATGNN